ncbi:hypothetical protein NDU88_003914 [Pleurodeles waltl]|uniref:Uncharacterized protein n=1 Tax=Pleurodeles waltl TaxID=8319 RepID=A0AAV7KZE6_PLEWA|nr:hypothetical protein NDU88_003914 [Pleurodeles waltl]
MASLAAEEKNMFLAAEEKRGAAEMAPEEKKLTLALEEKKALLAQEKRQHKMDLRFCWTSEFSDNNSSTTQVHRKGAGKCPCVSICEAPPLQEQLRGTPCRGTDERDLVGAPGAKQASILGACDCRGPSRRRKEAGSPSEPLEECLGQAT